MDLRGSQAGAKETCKSATQKVGVNLLLNARMTSRNHALTERLRTAK